MRLFYFAGLVAACGGNAGADHDAGRTDAPVIDAPVIDASTIDAPTDLPAGVYAIPMSTPDDAASFLYTPALSASNQTFLVMLDTGSTDVAIAGSACASCTGVSPRYTPGTSAVDTHVTDTDEYAYGNGWAGEVYTDHIGLGHGSPTVAVNFTDIEIQTNFFFNDDYQGILGACRDDLLQNGTTGLVTSLVGAGVTDELAMELCPADGTLWLGGYDPSHAGSAMVFTPLLQATADVVGGYPNADFYAVDMSAMQLGSADLGLTEEIAGGPILDSGTSLFYLPTPVEAQLIAAINASPAFATLFPGQVMTDPTGSAASAGCVAAGSGVTDAQIDDGLPLLVMTFGDGSAAVTIDAPALRSYMIDAGEGAYCLVTEPGGDGGNMIMGDMFLRGFVTVIDRANERAGFASDAFCPAPEVAGTGAGFRRPREVGRGAAGWKAVKAERDRMRRRARRTP